MFAKDITKDEINALPVDRYEGEIALITQQQQLTTAFDEIMQHPVVGFDTESKPAFRRGVWNPIALLQISIPEKTFIIRITHTAFDTLIRDFFASEQVKKVGISIRDDLKDLRKTWALTGNPPEAFHTEALVDLNDIAHQLEVPHLGVRRLTAIFLGFRVSKSQQTSNWENPELTEAQLRYAATDAWVCLEIYKKLKTLGYLSKT
jgi:ribonuclease D